MTRLGAIRFFLTSFFTLSAVACIAQTLSSAAQSDIATPSLNSILNQFRLNALSTHRVFHPEHGEVRTLRRLGLGTSQPALPLNRYLSVFVSDVDTTKAIKFSEVMDQLVQQSGDTQLTKQVLFSQWWDTQGQGPGLGLGPHCDDASPPNPPQGVANQTANSLLNGFPYRCPRLEATEAASDPFTNEVYFNPNAYSAIAFSNRFDLLSSAVDAGNGKVTFPDCGEYRIVFARNSGQVDPRNRNLIIFEARVANPDPRPEAKTDATPTGCLPILNFWHSLSDPQMKAEQRGAKLHDFYMNGQLLGGEQIGPIVDIDNYSFTSGQIRTNQFMLNLPKPPPAPFDWTLREFKAVKLNGTVLIVPDTVKANPSPDLFAAGDTDTRIAALSQAIRAQMKTILGIAHDPNSVDDVNSIGFSVAGEGVNAFESDEKGAPNDPAIGDIMATFDPGNTVPLGRSDAFVTNIQNALNVAVPGNTMLTPLNVIDRIRTQTCAGCHQFSDGSVDKIGLGGKAVWPNKRAGDVSGPSDLTNHPPMPFTQESEQLSDLRDAISLSAGGKNGKRWAISTTVECLLDAREKLIDEALGLPLNTTDHCPPRN
jgi:hypothetical protein